MKRTLFVVPAILLIILVLSLAACGGDAPGATVPSSAAAGDPVAGEKLFVSACTACHGLKGEGVPGLSGDMTRSEFTASATDQELFEFIKVGGIPDEPRVMLPKGGNPSLTDQNLADIVAYIRLLQK